MKKHILILTTAWMMCTMAKAQSNAGISGTIFTHEKKPLAAATIALLKASDSIMVKLTVSNERGSFAFENIPAAQYLLKYTAVGYEPLYSAPFLLQEGVLYKIEEPVVLTATAQDLKAVTVAATKKMIVQKADRMVLNVDAFVSNAGANALEVLEKAPGVMVDKDGNISLKGKQGVMVMLDGRPAYLSGAELANMLKGMQASQLEEIEIMTNPPARYDAAGNSGIINIKTKKNKQKGFNGNVSAGYSQGIYPKTNESISLNYRNGKVNLFSTYSFGYNIDFQELDIFRRYKNEDGSTNAIFEQNSFNRFTRYSNNLKLGMDYYLSSKTTLGITLGGFYNRSTENGENTSYLKSPANITDSIVYATYSEKNTWKNGQVNLYLQHRFDSTGREINTNLDYIVYNSTNFQHFTNETFTPQWVKKYDEPLQGDLPGKIEIYSVKADYTHPLSSKGKLEMGWKSGFVKTENKAKYFEWTGNWTPDYRKTFYFDYKENVHAFYLNLHQQLSDKWELQAGLRYENTSYEGYQYGNPTKTDSSFNKSYGSLFPTLYVTWKPHKEHQFNVSLGRRIDRPAYRNLNPFLFFLDKYTYAAGNPFLQPQYTNNLELTHTYKGFLTTTLNYSRTTDFFTETFDQEELSNGEKGYATIVRQGNIGKFENAGVAVSAQVPVGNWLSSMIFTNFSYSRFTGLLYGDQIDVSQGVLMINITNQFKFGKGWSGELGGWFRTKGVEGQMQIGEIGQATAGIAKQVLKGKGTVKLNVRDMFYSHQIRAHINFEATEAKFTNRFDTRVANITFTYRFGKPIKNDSPRKRNVVDELNRVREGN